MTNHEATRVDTTKQAKGKSMKTSELQGAALDWAAVMATGGGNLYWDDENLCFVDGFDVEFRPSVCWEHGGPIIERERIGIEPWGDEKQWLAQTYNEAGRVTFRQYGPTPLIAATRCFVASKLGKEIALPEELQGEVA